MKMKAPRSTPTTVSWPGGSVRRQSSWPELGDAVGDPVGGNERSQVGGWLHGGLSCASRPLPRKGDVGRGTWRGFWVVSHGGSIKQWHIRNRNRAVICVVLVTALLVLVGACAAIRAQGRHAKPTVPAVAHVEMEPIKIQATRGRRRRPSRPSTPTSCSSRPARRCPQSATTTPSGCTTSCWEFPASTYTQLGALQPGPGLQDKKDWGTAIDSFQELADKHSQHADAKDALFQLGASYAEMENWPTSARDLRAAARAQGPERRRPHRGARAPRLRPVSAEGLRHRRADLPFGAGVLPIRSRTRSGCRPTSSWRSPSTTSARSPTNDSARSPLRLPEKQMDRDLEEKARPAAQGPARLHRHHQAGQPAVGVRLRLSGRLALRGVLRVLRPRARPARALDRESRSARSTSRSCARRSASCWRSRCAGTRAESADARAAGGPETEWRGQVQARLRQAPASCSIPHTTRSTSPTRAAGPRPGRPAGTPAEPTRPGGRPAGAPPAAVPIRAPRPPVSTVRFSRLERAERRLPRRAGDAFRESGKSP